MRSKLVYMAYQQIERLHDQKVSFQAELRLKQICLPLCKQTQIIQQSDFSRAPGDRSHASSRLFPHSAVKPIQAHIRLVWGIQAQPTAPPGPHATPKNATATPHSYVILISLLDSQWVVTMEMTPTFIQFTYKLHREWLQKRYLHLFLCFFPKICCMSSLVFLLFLSFFSNKST